MENKDYLIWVDFYTEFANKLRFFKNNRATLINKIKSVFTNIGIKLPKLEMDNNIVDLCPFTVFGLFNKGITNANKISIIRGIATEFDVKAKIPESFDGVPLLNVQLATFYRFVVDRGDNDIDNLWDVFVSALDYADNKTEENKKKLINSFNVTIKLKGIKWNLTMGLYWIRPFTYLNLDSRTRWLIEDSGKLPEVFVKNVGKLKDIIDCEEYLSIIDLTQKVLIEKNQQYKNFVELSYHAWIESDLENKKIKEAESADAAIGDSGVKEIHYWIYTPGYGAEKWDEFYEEGIMGIAREYIGDLSQYSSKKAIQEAMNEKAPKTPDIGATTFAKAALEAWEFLVKVKPGDIIFAKKGTHTIIGRGVVTSEYIFDPKRDKEYVNIRKVKWTHKGEWEYPERAVTKVLTDITPYTDYVKNLNTLIDDESSKEVEVVKVEFPMYSEENFLSEVYMSKERYEVLKQLLRHKKNIILQGAPGVGKTYVAKRLCYSMLGFKDANRVMMIQFHQSYSYEDFIEGYRPDKAGFKLKNGPFYTFCRDAEKDDENDYFFIIDEINRGNLSKIFGELFMLIENDKRGVSLKLLYSDEKFSVPKNVHIIGMMNTADRSLAMLDYALRRRFAFFEFAPAFDTEGFREYQKRKNNPKFDNLIAAIQKLNVVIEQDATLGKGFRIGHSYFLTEREIDGLWLDSVINYEILPLLNEYWFDEPNKIKDWERMLLQIIK
jgi:5-methylcytosine-specific restriction protein B